MALNGAAPARVTSASKNQACTYSTWQQGSYQTVRKLPEVPSPYQQYVSPLDCLLPERNLDSA